MTTRIGRAGLQYTVPVDPDPETYRFSTVAVGSASRTLDGSLQSFFIASKGHWAVTWAGLTAAERDSLLTELRRQQHLVWTPYEGSDYTVRVQASEWRPVGDAEGRYQVSAELEEV